MSNVQPGCYYISNKLTSSTNEITRLRVAMDRNCIVANILVRFVGLPASLSFNIYPGLWKIVLENLPKYIEQRYGSSRVHLTSFQNSELIPR